MCLNENTAIDRPFLSNLFVRASAPMKFHRGAMLIAGLFGSTGIGHACFMQRSG
jgi:hypothetical protein